ncbi:cation:proton antiporter [Psychroflexus sp. YR1-1]|uniref:Cation:proton antiporter n=1 Tax=Psychroflexus aurantiacus TaxID=2709310 RepID=A0A6B3QZV7_9FLAO|nr:monovalent cation/H+ antiporter complex subunit F [Psychroflexus aurantiacus]NEV92600.1 cation:proton antiporter [Psychroflexus aurantiacus]
MNIHDFLYYIILPILSVSSLLVFVRFFKGPSIIDRVVALDLLITIGIGIIAIYSILSDTPTFLDISLVLALIAFLGSVAFAYYLEKRNKNE